MTTPTNSDRLREIAERAEKATPGPWRWVGNVDFESLDIESRGVPLGEVVMRCGRWGMQGAAPMFLLKHGLVRADKIARFEVCPTATSRKDPRVYRGDVTGINHPDADFMVHSRADVDFLLSEINKLNAEKAETIEVLEAFGQTFSSFHQQQEQEFWWDGMAKPLLDKLKGESP